MSKSINRYCNCRAGTCNGSFSDRRCAFKKVPNNVDLIKQIELLNQKLIGSVSKERICAGIEEARGISNNYYPDQLGKCCAMDRAIVIFQRILEK